MPKPKLTVFPRITAAPAAVTLFVTAIPNTARTICFILDGTNYYSGCQALEDKRSVQVQYRNVPAGEYVAAALVDGKVVGELSVTIVGVGLD